MFSFSLPKKMQRMVAQSIGPDCIYLNSLKTLKSNLCQAHIAHATIFHPSLFYDLKLMNSDYCTVHSLYSVLLCPVRDVYEH